MIFVDNQCIYYYYYYILYIYMFDWYGIVGDVNDKWVTVTYQQMTIVIEANLKQIQIKVKPKS